MIERISTGVQGLDELIEGGLPKGTATLVMGRPGAGKTILASQFVYSGATKYGENGIIGIVGQSPDKFKKDISRFGWDFEKLEAEKKVIITEQTILTDPLNLPLIDIISMAKKINAKRIVIDSFSLLLSMLSSASEKRREMMSMIKYLSENGHTLLLVTDKTAENHYPEEFLADGVVDLDYVTIKDKLIRNIAIPKMRRTALTDITSTYKIGKNGFVIFPKLRIEPLTQSSAERTKTGISGLDNMTGGLFKGSSTVVTGNSGTGKTILGMQFLQEGAKSNEAGVMICFEECPSEIFRTASSFGWDFKQMEKAGTLSFLHTCPENVYLEELLQNIRQTLEKTGAKRIVLDSLSNLRSVFDEGDLRDFTKRLVVYAKNRTITSILTDNVSSLTGTEITGAHISTIADNIIMLRYVEIESAIRRYLVMLKMRGGKHDNEIREIEIGKNGIEIKAPFKEFEGIISGSAKRTAAEKFVKAFKA